MEIGLRPRAILHRLKDPEEVKSVAQSSAALDVLGSLHDVKTNRNSLAAVCSHMPTSARESNAGQSLLYRIASPTVFPHVSKHHKRNLLQSSIIHGDCSHVTKLLHQNIPLNTRFEDGSCPLPLACAGGNLPLIRLLVDHAYAQNHNLVNQRDTAGQTALHVVCAVPADQPNFNHAAIIKYLMQHGAVANIRNGNKHTPMGLACRNGNATAISTLMAQGAKLKAADVEEACRAKHYGLAETLLKRISDVDPKESVYQVAQRQLLPHLAVFARHGRGLEYEAHHTDILNTIIREVIDVQDQHAFLFHLINLKGADLSVVDEDNRTILMLAASSGSSKAVKDVLRHYTANLNAKDRESQTALHHACAAKNSHAVIRILGHNPRVNIKNDNQETPLMVALNNELPEAVLALTQAGAITTLQYANKLSIIGKAMRLSRKPFAQAVKKLFEDLKEAPTFNTLLFLIGLKGDATIHSAMEQFGGTPAGLNAIAKKLASHFFAAYMIKNHADIAAKAVRLPDFDFHRLPKACRLTLLPCFPFPVIKTIVDEATAQHKADWRKGNMVLDGETFTFDLGLQEIHDNYLPEINDMENGAWMRGITADLAKKALSQLPYSAWASFASDPAYHDVLASILQLLTPLQLAIVVPYLPPEKFAKELFELPTNQHATCLTYATLPQKKEYLKGSPPDSLISQSLFDIDNDCAELVSQLEGKEKKPEKDTLVDLKGRLNTHRSVSIPIEEKVLGSITDALRDSTEDPDYGSLMEQTIFKDVLNLNAIRSAVNSTFDQVSLALSTFEEKKEPPQEYLCSIGTDLMEQPVDDGCNAKDPHWVDLSNFKAHFETGKKTCPFTGKPLSVDKLTVDLKHKKLIDDWKTLNADR